MSRAFAVIRLTALSATAAAAMCCWLGAAANDTSGRITMLSPKPGQKLSGKSGRAEIAVGYSFENDRVSYAELYVDGKLHSVRHLEQPQSKSVCSFICDAAGLSNAPHVFVVKLFAGDRLLGSSTTTAEVSNRASDSSAPNVRFHGIGTGHNVAGRQEIKLVIEDDSDPTPMVSVWVDKDLKLISNRPPYSFTLDTSELADGPHVISASATDQAGNMSKLETVQVIVSNGTRVAVASAPANEAEPVAARVGDSAAASQPAVPAKIASLPVKTDNMRSPRNEAGRSIAPDLPESPFLAGPVYSPPPRPIRDRRTETKTQQVTVSPEPRRADPPNPEVAVETAATAAGPTAENGPVEKADTGEAAKSERAVVNTPSLAPAHAEQKRIVLAPKLAPTAPPASLKGLSSIRRAEPYGPPAPRSLVKMGLLLGARDVGGDVPPFINGDGVGIAPLRRVIESLGGQVTWDPRTRRVTAYAPKAVIQLSPGENVAIVNRRRVQMKSAAYIESGRAMVPVTFIAQVLGLEVYYDAAAYRFILASALKATQSG